MANFDRLSTFRSSLKKKLGGKDNSSFQRLSSIRTSLKKIGPDSEYSETVKKWTDKIKLKKKRKSEVAADDFNPIPAKRSLQDTRETKSKNLVLVPLHLEDEIIGQNKGLLKNEDTPGEILDWSSRTTNSVDLDSSTESREEIFLGPKRPSLESPGKTCSSHLDNLSPLRIHSKETESFLSPVKLLAKAEPSSPMERLLGKDNKDFQSPVSRLLGKESKEPLSPVGRLLGKENRTPSNVYRGEEHISPFRMMQKDFEPELKIKICEENDLVHLVKDAHSMSGLAESLKAKYGRRKTSLLYEDRKCDPIDLGLDFSSSFLTREGCTLNIRKSATL